MTRFSPRLVARLACSAEDVAAAQALRFRVFVEELGGTGGGLTAVGREADRFDDAFEHLLLIDTLTDRVIGTTRLATEDAARRVGAFASECEFDIAPLRRSGRRLLEIGRTCLDPGHRGGEALHRLWQGLAVVAEERRAELVFGLASLPGMDVDAVAEPLAWLHHEHRAPEALRPRSLEPVAMDRLPRESVDRRAAVLALPALVKAYIRLGAWVGAGACLDPAFGCIDLCMVLDRERLSARARGAFGPAVG